MFTDIRSVSPELLYVVAHAGLYNDHEKSLSHCHVEVLSKPVLPQVSGQAQSSESSRVHDADVPAESFYGYRSAGLRQETYRVPPVYGRNLS